MLLLALALSLQDTTFQSDPLSVRVDSFGRFTILRGGVPLLRDAEFFAGARGGPGRPWQDVNLLRPPIRESRRTERGVLIRLGRDFEVAIEPAPGHARCVVRVALRPKRELNYDAIRIAGQVDPEGVLLRQRPTGRDPRPPAAASLTSYGHLVWGTGTSATLAGFLAHRVGLNTVSLDASGSLQAVSRLGSLAAGSAIEFDPLELSWGSDPHALQAGYLDRMLAALPPGARTQHGPVPTGWSSWPGFAERVTEEDVVRNAELLAKRLRHFQVVLVDDGHQRACGDWTTNDRFPRGHRRLAEKIRSLGLKPGLWIAPFVISEGSAVFRDHSEWMVRADGKPLPMTDVPRWGGRTYCLDPTHPDARAWLKALARTAVEEWGYEHLVLDFLHYPLAARALHAGGTPVQAIVAGLEAIREGAGSAFLVAAGIPPGPALGIVDGYATGASSGASRFALREAAAAATAACALRGPAGWNDPGRLLVGDPLTPAEARAWASLACVTGQSVFAGEDLTRLGPDRIEILSRTLPTPPMENPRPIDIFTEERAGTPFVRTGSGAVHVRGPWKFRKGDDPGWAAIDLDDSGWGVVRVPSRWDPTYDGYGWYRARFKATAGEGVLELGRIDDEDDTYLNGERVGGMTDWLAFRRYPVKLREDNVLAIRVRDIHGEGGLYSLDLEDPVGEIWCAKLDGGALVALFNHADEPRKHSVRLGDRFCAYETWSGEYRRGVERIEDTVEPRGARVWVLRRPLDRPQVIADPGRIAGWGSSEWRDGTLSGSGEAVIDAAGYAPEGQIGRLGPLYAVKGARWSIRFGKRP